MKRQIGILLLALTIAIGFSGLAVALDVEAIQKGPSKAKKGDNVILSYEIKNKGSEPIYDVQIHSQTFSKQFEIINPGETKTYKHMMHIPTDEEVKEDFGGEATVSNPFYVGGVEVTFNDAQGLSHSITSNPIKINLVSGRLYDYQRVGTVLYKVIHYNLNTLLENKKPPARISPDEAKEIAQKFIEQPGATAGEAKLVIIDGKATYIVPVMLNDNQVGEIHIDAQTGENIGGAGGVNDNKTNLTENNKLNNIKSKNTSESGSKNELNNRRNSKICNTNNRSVNEGSNSEYGQVTENGYNKPAESQ